MKLSFFAFLLAAALVFPLNASAQQAGPFVELSTSKGKIVLELNSSEAPKTVDNFIKYVEAGHYDGTIFHRVIESFMIQGGGMDAKMKERQTRAPIANEAKNGLRNNHYTVAMARTGDPHSATAQFFINTSDNVFLNHSAESSQGWGYAVFGKVVSGQSVVDEIAKSKTGRLAAHENVPIMPVYIEKAIVLKDYKK